MVQGLVVQLVLQSLHFLHDVAVQKLAELHTKSNIFQRSYVNIFVL